MHEGQGFLGWILTGHITAVKDSQAVVWELPLGTA